MKMKGLIIFFLLLSISLSFDHCQAKEPLNNLDASSQGAPAFKPIQPSPYPSGVCFTAIKTCLPRKGFLGGWIHRSPSLPRVTSECCDAVRKIEDVDRQCFPYGHLFHWIINYSCGHHPIPSPPLSRVPPLPSPQAPPASASCPFVDACNVKFKGFFPTYNTSNPDCCRVVKGTPRLQGQCFRYSSIFYRMRFECCHHRPFPSRGQVHPPQPSPPLPPPKVDLTSPSTPPPALKPIQPPPAASTPIQPPPQAPPIPPART